MVQVLLLAIALVTVIYVATEFTHGTPEKVALDFGLGALSLSSIGMAIFLGVGLLAKEVDSRTVYMVLCRPISRSTFVLGKIFGMMAVLILNTFILGAVTITFCHLLGGQVGPLVYWVLLFSILEATLMLLFVVFFSLMTNNILSVLFTISILIIGHALGETKTLTFAQKNNVVANIIKYFEYVLPNLSKLNFKDHVLYEQNLSSEVLFGALTYGTAYATFILFLTCILFTRKNLD